MAFGLLIAVPTVIVAGPLFGAWIGKRVIAQPPERLVAEFTKRDVEPLASAPSFGVTLSTVLLPVVLMLGKAVADVLLAKDNIARSWIDFIGDPLMALLLAVIVAMFTFGYVRGFSKEKVSALLGSSLAPRQ